MDASVFAEWMIFDAMEPLDASGAMLRGLSGGTVKKRMDWEEQKAAMKRHMAIIQGGKNARH